jgi:hypothetical protein
MVPEVIATLADHAQGNLRSLMIMADELLGCRLAAKGLFSPSQRGVYVRRLNGWQSWPNRLFGT